MTEEKQDKKEGGDQGKGSKNRDSWKQDRLDSAGWGLFFLRGALVIVAEVTNFANNLSWWSGWSVFFIEAGIITLIQLVIRLLVPRYRNKWMGNLIGTGILFALGFFLGEWEGLGWFWVLLLAIIGIVILAKVFTSRCQTLFPVLFYCREYQLLENNIALLKDTDI